jgi:deazaflavin-dependent oxidoreductase (nitroreductase family)
VAVRRYSRLAQRLGQQRWFSAVGRRVAGLDRFLYQHSGGRLTFARGMGPATLVLTTIGRSSGQRRSVELLYCRVDGSYAVVASNWGQRQHPAWSANLLAQPDCWVLVGSTEVPVRARLADDAERDRLWTTLVAMWPAYRSYAERSGRDFRLFVLDPR